MSQEENVQQVETGYGYNTDEVKVSPFNFGGNFGKAFLTKFEYIPNGGKDGAEGDALDIVFNINGTDKSYRLFPVTQAFGKDNQVITDPNSQEMRDAIGDFNSRIVHILHCFVPDETVKAKMGSRVVKSFKDFAQLVASILPPNFSQIPLDIFMQYQWQIRGDQKRTFLEIPTKMKYGKFICAAIPGNWKEFKAANPSDTDREALYYVNEAGLKHPFIKNGWFINSNLSKQQKLGGDDEVSNDTANAIAGNINQGTATGAAPAGW